MRGSVEWLDPEGLARHPAFTNAVVVSGAVRTVYVGGQDAVDASSAVVGVGDLRIVTEQIFRNLRTALAADGAGREHLIKMCSRSRDPRQLARRAGAAGR